MQDSIVLYVWIFCAQLLVQCFDSVMLNGLETPFRISLGSAQLEGMGKTGTMYSDYKEIME